MDDSTIISQGSCREPTTLAGTGPIVAGDGASALVFDAGGETSRALFLEHVRGVAEQLPQGRHAVNLCEDRYRFMVAFCAVALRGQGTLLPPSRAPAAVDVVLAQHPESYCLGDDALDPAPPRYWRLPQCLPRRAGDVPSVADAALAAIGFTSGSTGQPGASRKTWGALRTSTAQNLAALQALWPGDCVPHVVATVPPQHMYGLELSVLLPLLGAVAVHAGRPFFPGDVAAALAQAVAPRVLVTTPVHLRALLKADLELPPLAAVVSATAPLDAALAQAVETRFQTRVQEFFGSTETCIVASRRPARESVWTALPGVRLQPQPDGTRIDAPHLPSAVVLADLVEVVDERRAPVAAPARDDNDAGPRPCRFRLRGRNADLVEIAGKRASLGDLNHKLLALPGVSDGVMFQLEADASDGVCRIAALVVAPGVAPEAIVEGLRAGIDPVFLPRPLRCVAALPRNETGKLPRADLLALLNLPG